MLGVGGLGKDLCSLSALAPIFVRAYQQQSSWISK